jgi:hypothetical protein
MFSDSFEKVASGDMLQYFRDNPKKLEELKERQKAKKKKRFGGKKKDKDDDDHLDNGAGMGD